MSAFDAKGGHSLGLDMAQFRGKNVDLTPRGNLQRDIRVRAAKEENAMSDMATTSQQQDDLPLCEDYSDQVLEAAACARNEQAGNFTLGACTGLSVCPG